MNTKDVGKRFAAMLLAIKALKINMLKPYTWASGWNSPVYCNNRRILSYPQERSITKEMMMSMIIDKYGDQKIVLAGVATGAIGLGAIVAEALGLPFVYVRPEPKDHGLGTQIEGVELTSEHKVVVFEDLVSTGKSSLQIVEVIRSTGAEVLGMVAFFTYGFSVAIEGFEAANVSLDTLSNYDVLMEVAEEQMLIEPGQKDILEQWRLDPANWKPEMVS